MVKSASSSKSIASYFKPCVSQSAIEVEFVSKILHFLLLTTNPVFFSNIFKDYVIAKMLSCALTKRAPIATDALAPDYTTTKIIKNIFNPFL